MSSDPYRGLTWNGNRWVCRWCLGRGCLSCPPEPRVLPAPRPADEPDELIQHVYVEDGHGLCGYSNGPEDAKCGKRKGVHHLLASFKYEDLNDPNSEAGRIFRPEVLGPDAMLHAFGPNGRGIDEIRENIERARAAATAAAPPPEASGD